MLHGMGHMPLFLGEGRREEQFGHTEDSVHRSADFMTHVGQELRLCDAGRFSGIFRKGQFSLNRLDRGNVRRDTKKTRDRPFGIA